MVSGLFDARYRNPLIIYTPNSGLQAHGAGKGGSSLKWREWTIRAENGRRNATFARGQRNASKNIPLFCRDDEPNVILLPFAGIVSLFGA